MNKRGTPESPRTPDPPNLYASVAGNVAKDDESDREKFSSDCIFQIQHGVSDIEIDDELIVGDLLRNRYFRMNSSAAFIWKSLGTHQSFGQLVDLISSNHGLERSKAEEFAADYLREAVALNILTTSANEKHKWQRET